MNSRREWIEKVCSQMRIGDKFVVHRFDLQEAYPYGFPSIYNNAKEAFLSSMVGSAWGCWTIEDDLATGDYIICRNRERKERVYVDPDRAYLFRKNLDETLTVRKELLNEDK